MPDDPKQIHYQTEISGGAALIGEDLRDARLALGYSVEEMAAHLRIRRAHLDALEEGRIRDLPGLAYVLGFLRSYAEALGLDADAVVARYRAIPGVAAAKPDLVFPEPKARGLPTGQVMTVGSVLAICLYVAWFNLSGAGVRAVDVVPPVPPRLEAAAERGQAQLAGAAEAGALPLAALPPPGGVAPLPSPIPHLGGPTAAQAATVATARPPVPEPPAAEVSATRITLRARPAMPEGAWVQVRDPRGGAVMLSRVLRPGEAWPVPARDGLLLDTGKADALEIIVDGQPSSLLDGQVGVRRNIALDAERLRQRPATARN